MIFERTQTYFLIGNDLGAAERDHYILYHEGVERKYQRE